MWSIAIIGYAGASLFYAMMTMLLPQATPLHRTNAVSSFTSSLYDMVAMVLYDIGFIMLVVRDPQGAAFTATLLILVASVYKLLGSLSSGPGSSVRHSGWGLMARPYVVPAALAAGAVGGAAMAGAGQPAGASTAEMAGARGGYPATGVGTTGAAYSGVGKPGMVGAAPGAVATSRPLSTGAPVAAGVP